MKWNDLMKWNFKVCQKIQTAEKRGNVSFHQSLTILILFIINNFFNPKKKRRKKIMEMRPKMEGVCSEERPKEGVQNFQFNNKYLFVFFSFFNHLFFLYYHTLFFFFFLFFAFLIWYLYLVFRFFCGWMTEFEDKAI